MFHELDWNTRMRIKLIRLLSEDTKHLRPEDVQNELDITEDHADHISCCMISIFSRADLVVMCKKRGLFDEGKSGHSLCLELREESDYTDHLCDVCLNQKNKTADEKKREKTLILLRAHILMHLISIESMSVYLHIHYSWVYNILNGEDMPMHLEDYRLLDMTAKLMRYSILKQDPDFFDWK